MSALSLAVCLYAQPRVSGTVKAQSGEPLPGVNVLVKGTNDGTITDGDGRFAINVSDGVLVFSFIGYRTVEMPVNGKTSLEVVLEEDITTLEQVVVIGYGTQKKKDLTTAVVVVDGTAIQDRPLVSAAEALQGKAAGVQVIQPSGKPGGDISVRVRGATSVVAGNEPLYVVDGVPTTDIRGLNPADIASMTVLKDAASASIYGARAANGVVLISTKRGVSNTPVVAFSAYTGFSQLRKTIDVLNTEQYKTLMAEVPTVGAIDPAITNYTNWSDKVFGTGVNQSYQLSFSGGTQATRFNISGNYLKNKGIVSPAQFDRYSIRMNLDNEVKKWLKIGTSLSFISSKTKDTPDNLSSGRGGVIMSALNTPPFLNVYKNDGSGQFDPNPFQPSWENPVAYMEGPSQKALDNRLFGNITADFKILKNLTYKTNVGVDLQNHQWDYYLDPFRTVNGRQQNGSAQAQRTNSNTWLLENTLNYTQSFGEHNLNVVAGSSLQENKYYVSHIAGHDFPKDSNTKTLNAANIIDNAYTSTDSWSLASFFGRANYDYQGKYLLTVSVRRDGSSKLSNGWGTMPSVSAGWRISAEPFMQNISQLNELKLRASWGRNGNQEGISNYAQYGLISYTRRSPQNPLAGPAGSQTSYGNPDLKWETTDQTGIGVDVIAFDARVSLTVDAYLKKTKDVLLNVQLPSSSPITSIQTNNGSIQNKGIEVSLSTVNVEREGLKWSTDFNISFNRNKVTLLNLTDVYYYGRIYSNNQDVSIVRAGLPLGSFFGYISEGVDPSTGNIRYKDVNNNGIVDTGDRGVIGNAQPNFIYGITNNVSYKRFDLNLFFQGSQGNDIYNATRIDLEGMFDSKNQSTDVLRRWTPDNPNTDIPKAGNMDNVRNSTRFVENGSYLRLKAVTLSYRLDTDMLSKAKINKASVYVTGQNLLTFTKYSGFDPEVNAFGRSATELGIDYGTYPQARTIIVGVNLEF